jgi:trimeric autotransporter adhesin
VTGVIGGFSGDGGIATAAAFNFPSDVSVDKFGELLIADTTNNRIRLINQSGVVTTIAGNGNFQFSGDGGPALGASLAARGISPDSELYEQG